MSKDDEMILVVPTALFHKAGYFQGFSTQVERYTPILLAPENLQFRRRGEMEKSPEYKQLIPYILLSWTDPIHREVSLFTYVRGKGMGESRLHAKASVGVGGHINNADLAAAQQDGNRRNLYREGLLRELHEEVVLDPKRIVSEQCVGLINDDLTEVGKVHLGIVHRIELSEPLITPNEPDLIESGFRTITELLSGKYPFESWSEITINALFGQKKESL